MPNDPLDRVDKLSSRSPRELALEQRVIEAEKERDRAAVNQTNTVDAMTVALNIQQDRAETAEQQSAQLRSALAELVRLKDLKDSVNQPGFNSGDQSSGYPNVSRVLAEYRRSQPLAWEAARKALHTATGESE